MTKLQKQKIEVSSVESEKFLSANNEVSVSDLVGGDSSNF